MALFSSRNNLLFMGGHFANDLCQNSLPIILAYMYQAGMLESYSQVAMLIMANTVLNTVVQPVSGMLADSKPRPWIMSLGLGLTVFGIMFTGLTSHLWLLFVLVCLNGMGSSIFHPYGGMLTHVFAGARPGRSMSVFSVGGNLGMACGPFFFTFFYLFCGLNATLFYCLPGLVMITLFLRRNRLYTVACERSLENRRHRGAAEGRDNVPAFVKLVAVLFLRSAGWYSVATFLTLYFMHRLGVADEISSTLNGTVCLFGALATFLGGLISDKVGIKRLINVTSLCSVPFIALFPWTQSPTLATLLIIGFTFMYFASMSPIVVVGQHLLPNHVGMATGFTIGLAMGFGGLVAPLVGKLGDLYGIETVFYCVACFITLAALGTLLIPREMNHLKR